MKKIIMFTAKWCGHCIKQKHAFDDSFIKPVYVDIDEEIYDAYRNLVEIHELPTIVIVEDSKPIKTYIGETDVKEIEKEL